MGLLSLLNPIAVDNCDTDVDISFSVKLEETDPCLSKTIIILRPQLEHIFIPDDAVFACEQEQDGDAGTPGVQIGYEKDGVFTPTDTVYLNTEDYTCGYILQQESTPVRGNDCGRKAYIDWS